MKYKGLWQLFAMSMVIFGFSGIILQLIGTQWVFLRFLDVPGRLFGFVARILMVMAGVIIMVLANTDWEQERREIAEENEAPL